jgi:hypothetical protein
MPGAIPDELHAQALRTTAKLCQISPEQAARILATYLQVLQECTRRHLRQARGQFGAAQERKRAQAVRVPAP